jgi:hypothetical protein
MNKEQTIQLFKDIVSHYDNFKCDCSAVFKDLQEFLRVHIRIPRPTVGTSGYGHLVGVDRNMLVLMMYILVARDSDIPFLVDSIKEYLGNDVR